MSTAQNLRQSSISPLPMKHVVMFSGGIGSWATAKRVADQRDPENLILLFADTKVEDEDTYRFLHAAAENVGGELVIVADGRTPFEVFRDDRFLGNSRLANCSKFLKQKPCREWLEANGTAEDTIVYVGIDWTEQHRMPAIEKGWAPFPVAAPMCDRPFIDKPQMIEWANREGLTPPAAYGDGMPHANCLAQGCVRGGQAYWATLLRTNREAFLYSEAEEEKLRQHLDADVSILKDRTGGDVSVLTLAEFRARLDQQPSLFDSQEWGGCGCFTDDGPDLIQIAEAA